MPDITAEPIRILTVDNYLGETPVWSVQEQALYWINCERPPALHRWHHASGRHEQWPMPSRIGGVVLNEPGSPVVTLSDGIYRFDTRSATLTLQCRSPLPDHVGLHEAQCDRQGRLWVGSYDHHFSPTQRHHRDGAYFRWDGEHLTPVIEGISVANALAFSPDGRTLYASDSPTRLIEAFDLDPASGELSNRRPFVRLEPGQGFVDGATVDAEGGFWLAAVGAGALRRYFPDGKLDRVVAVPCSNPTKAAFGGPDLDILFITSTRLEIGAGSVDNGGLFALRPGERGLPEPLLVRRDR